MIIITGTIILGVILNALILNRAIQFTNESNTRLGKLKRANQGLFKIVDRDEALSNSVDGGYATGVSDIFKKIRVVWSIRLNKMLLLSY